MENTTIVDVKVSALLVGDVMKATGERIEGISVGYPVERGKARVRLASSGYRASATWNLNTVVRVIRKA